MANDMSLVISPAQIVEALKPIPGMVDSNGRLNPGAISQLARANNINEPQFLDLIAGDLMREQVLRSVAGGVGMPSGMERALNLYRLERRVADYLIIDPSRVVDIKDPDDGALKAYFEENATARYSTPESRSIVLISVRPEEVGKTIIVPDADIAKLYEANRKRYEVPEKRVLEQIRFKSEAAATAAKAKLDAGEKFEAVAKTEGFSPDDIKLGEVTKGDDSVPAVAFETPLMQATVPSKNSFGGWVIVRATSSTPGSLKTLDEVREEIRKAVVDSKVRDEIFEIGNKMEDAIGGGATLEETATQLKLPLQTVTITRDGNDPAGNPAPGLPGGDFLEQAFTADTGTDPELLQTPDGVYYEFRVDKITKSAKKDFEAIKALVLSDWRDAEMSKRLDRLAAEILKRAKGGEALSSIATSQNISVVTSDPFPRFGRSATFGEATVLAASDAKKGEFFTGPVALGKGVIVGKVTDIQFTDEPLDSPMRSAYLQRLVQSYVSDFVEQFETGVRQKVGASIDEERFKAFHNNE
jgi:peptidyl-prolyl cis-trans isomerase D